jgi:16S rRNA (guanine527-N7)-methyltransferase
VEHFEYLENWPKNVPRETFVKLECSAALLAEWNEKFNLVAESTIPQVWTRHFLDSAQLMQFIPETAKTIADLGSGAGFPGLVLSIMGAPEVHLIESTGKKANFLRAVINELKLNAVVHQERVENLKNFKADVITARALAPLKDTLKLAKPLMKKESLCLLLKGEKAPAELTESAKYWTFDCETHRSLSDRSGSVLIIRNLRINDAHRHPRRQRA